MKVLTIMRFGAVVAGVLPAAAFADPIFFDDFSGTALGPHWTTVPDPQYAQYTVANGRLTVDWIQAPLGSPWGTVHNAPFRAEFPAHSGDFVATTRLGWESGDHRSIWVTLVSRPAPILGQMAYSDRTGNVQGTLGGTGFWVPGVAPGTHDFEIARVGSLVYFSLNSQQFGSMAVPPDPLNSVVLDVRFMHPGSTFQPVYFESILIVPAPGSVLAGVGIAVMFTLRRRRS